MRVNTAYPVAHRLCLRCVQYTDFNLAGYAQGAAQLLGNGEMVHGLALMGYTTFYALEVLEAATPVTFTYTVSTGRVVMYVLCYALQLCGGPW